MCAMEGSGSALSVWLHTSLPYIPSKLASRSSEGLRKMQSSIASLPCTERSCATYKAQFPTFLGVGVHSPETCCFSSFLNGHKCQEKKFAFFYSLVTPTSESSVKSTGMKLFWSYSTYKTFSRWKPEKRLLLRCIAHLFRAISRCKTKNRHFSFDPFQLDPVSKDPKHVFIFCTQKYSESAAASPRNPTSISHLTYNTVRGDKPHQRTSVSTNVAQPLTFFILLGKRNHSQAHLESRTCLSDVLVLFSSGYLIIY